jgi:hypothetical protein
LIFIREPFKTGFLKGLELGHPLKTKELVRLINWHLPSSQIHYCDNNLLIFYTHPDYAEQVETFLYQNAVIS